MRRKIGRLLILIAAVISLGIFSLKGFGKESGFKSAELIISEKIDEILSNQKDIITRLEDIKKELDIIRVRASRR